MFRGKKIEYHPQLNLTENSFLIIKMTMQNFSKQSSEGQFPNKSETSINISFNLLNYPLYTYIS